MTTADKHLLQKSAGKAGELLGIISWEDDLKLLKVYTLLSNLYGNDETLMHHWMQTQNKHLDGKVPANLITTTEGTEKLISLLGWYSQ